MTVKTTTDLTSIVNILADMSTVAALYSGNRKVKAEYLIKDGRTRKSIWRELVKQGYLTPTENDGEAILTEKAFDQIPVPVEGFTLSDLYKFDAYEARQGKGQYVVWDRLTIYQKKVVILAMRENPMSYTLSAVDTRYSPPKVAHFKLGGASAAQEAVSGWHSTLVVTDATVTEKHAKAAREQYRAECVSEGLNWFLRKIGVIDPEETVPVSEKQPTLGGYASIDRDPENWAGSLPQAIERTKETIQKARQRLLALEKLEKAVEAAGGWDAFKGQYEAAIDAYVEAKMKE